MKKTILLLAIVFLLATSCVGYRVESEHWNGGESYMYEPVVNKAYFENDIVKDIAPNEAMVFYSDKGEWFYSGTSPKRLKFVEAVASPVIVTNQLSYGTVALKPGKKAEDVVTSFENQLNFPFFMMFSGGNFGSYYGGPTALTTDQGIFYVSFTNTTRFPAKELVFVDSIDNDLKVVDVMAVEGGFGAYQKIRNGAKWELIQKNGSQYVIIKIDMGSKPLKQPFRGTAAVAIVVERK